MQSFDLRHSFDLVQDRCPFGFLYDNIAEALRQSILVEAIPAGSHLNDGDIAKQLGVSRTPVLRAFAQLRQEGLLSYSENMGYSVTMPTQSRQLTLMQFREAIEPTLAYYATKEASDNDIRKLMNLCHIFRNPECSTKQVVEADIAFHTGLCNLCANQYLQEAYRSQMPLIAYSIRLNLQYMKKFQSSQRREDIYQLHMQIVFAIKTGNGRMAMEAAFYHLRKADVSLLDFPEMKQEP